MLDDLSDIKAYYNNSDSEITRLERHQLERDITWRHLVKYLPSTGSILEIGAASGAYTVELVRRGYDITAVDISNKLLDICKKRISDEGLDQKVSLFISDARDLSELGEKLFDVVLLMGPLYHLVIEEDRKSAVREAFKHTKPGGIIFSTFVSRYGIWGDIMKKIPHSIERQDDLRTILEKGKDSESNERQESTEFRGYFAKSSEIAPLHEEAGFKTLIVAGIEPCISADDESYNILQGLIRKLWLDLLYELSTEESIIAASRHLLYIGRKPENKGL
jgi:S-adenosylmethionine-dependent methyltransferase